MTYAVNLAGINLEHPVMNAAGTCKMLDGEDGVRNLVRSALAAVMVGSMTLEKRLGNEGEVYWDSGNYSLNSLGLPNPGANYYKQFIPEMAALAHEAKKPLFVSIAGFNPEEYGVLAGLASRAGADLIELNLSCPNVWDKGEQKRIASFDPPLIEEIIGQVKDRIKRETRVAVKLSPCSDPFLLAEISSVISSWRIINAVTAVNTFPNAFCLDEQGKPRITPGGGLAGLGGPAMKPIGLGHVKQLRSMLPERVSIIGAGGIASGQDVLDYLKAGAVAVQVATSFMNKQARVFDSLLAELIQITD